MRIIAKNLVQNYEGLHAVNDISLEIPEGKIFGIIGKSGAGKSTLLRMISLLERPESGEIYFDDKRVDNLKKKDLIQERRKIGMIFQTFNLLTSRNAERNVAYPMEICHTPKEEIKKRCSELLELVGLTSKAKVGISKMSGGQKQRVAIARALATNPSVLFCDEATSALDPGTTRQVLSLIKEVQKKFNLTVIMVTHQMEVVRDACDEVAVINNGKIVEQGEVEKVFSNPQSDVTRDFLSNLKTETAKDAIEKGMLDDKMVTFSKGGKYILRFPENKTGEPVLSRIIKSQNVGFNIFGAGVQYVKGKELGTIQMDIIGSEDDVENVIKELESEGIVVEEAKI